MRKLPRKPDPIEQWAATQDAVRLPDEKICASAVRAAVKRSGLTTAEIARRSGLPRITVQRIVGYGPLAEAGPYRKQPSVLVLVRLLEACGAELIVRWPQLGARR